MIQIRNKSACTSAHSVQQKELSCFIPHCHDINGCCQICSVTSQVSEPAQLLCGAQWNKDEDANSSGSEFMLECIVIQSPGK